MKRLTSFKGVKVIAFKDAAIRLLDGKEKVVGVVPLPAGPLDLTPYHPLAEAGIIEVCGLFIVSSPTGKLQVVKCDKRFDTAANPDFTPSTEYREKRQMEKMVEMVVERQDQKARKEREEMERIRQQREKEREEVVLQEEPPAVESEGTKTVEPPKEEANAESAAPAAAD